MAFMNQVKKNILAPEIKRVLKKYKMSGTLAVSNYSSLVCNISKGELDIIGNKKDTILDGYIQVNHYYLSEHYTGKVLDFLKELYTAMNATNHDNSDIMSDYFDVGYYININVGQWDKPYIFIQK